MKLVLWVQYSKVDFPLFPQCIAFGQAELQQQGVSGSRKILSMADAAKALEPGCFATGAVVDVGIYPKVSYVVLRILVLH